MSEYEYRVIAAPTKGVKAKGKKTVEDRFANALEIKMNEMAQAGWNYVRAEALPSTERSGLTSSKTVWHNMLVFRRKTATVAVDDLVALPAPTKEAPSDDPEPLRKTPPLTATQASEPTALDENTDEPSDTTTEVKSNAGNANNDASETHENQSETKS